jgi:hypothetical protein
MKTTVLTNNELKQIITEIFFNKQTKATKITDESVNNAIFFASGRVGQKAMKDIAVIESMIFPVSAQGSYLDQSAALFGGIERYGASGSSTYILVIADNGTLYPQASTQFKATNGQTFELVEDLIVEENGFAYGKIRSTGIGKLTNSEANTITKVDPAPAGHIALTNEFTATGGRDIETDEDLRNRIFSHNNKISQKTLQYLSEIFRQTNEDVLFIQNLGFDEQGLLNISVVLQNGADLTENERNSLLDASQGYFALTDINVFGDDLGIKLVNPTWYEVGGNTGIDFRVEIYSNFDIDQVRKNIQIAMSRYFDIRYWTEDRKVEWDDLLQIVKQTEGVKYVPDDFFKPSVDEIVPLNELPRIKKFVMRDIDGNLISDNQGVLTPIFYPLEQLES